MNRDTAIFPLYSAASPMLDITLHNSRQHRQFQHAAGPLVLARTQSGDAVWKSVDQARAEEADALMEIVPAADGVDLQMAGCEGECFCGRRCGLTGICHLAFPARFSIGDTRFEILDVARQSASRRPLEVLLSDKPGSPGATTTGRGPSPATLSRWFDALGAMHRWVTSSQEFYNQAARCAVESIGLDGAVVLRRRDEAWEIAASYLPNPQLGIHCDRGALDQLLQAPRTLFHGTDGSGGTAPDEGESANVEDLLDYTEALLIPGAEHAPADQAMQQPNMDRPVEADLDEPAVVVSPVFNVARQLAGAIYGFRSVRKGNARRSIRYLEAHLIELLANSVSEGISRLEREAEIDRRRVLLEQAFAATLEQNPQRMAGETREITLLFVDLRGFSDLSTKLDVEQTYGLLGDVMDCLTAAVMDHDGLVIDYYGDGLAAMWNAPASQPEHPELACRAALRMVETLPGVERRWAGRLPDSLRLGIGVHTGLVQVGNAGSTRRLKYGPRGVNVHLASRVEAATKELGVVVLVTGSTVARLSNRVLTYRLCRAGLPGINEPVELYGIRMPTSNARDLEHLAEYQRALEFFEEGSVAEAARLLPPMETGWGDLPTRFLAEKVRQALGQQQGRRGTDAATGPTGPVIRLNVK